jgi:mannose/fructose-specific phosphotransferase system component IIA
MTSSGTEAESSEPEPQTPRAIIAGHGSFPEGMVSAVEQISGYGNVFVGLSNSGLTGEDIESRLRARAEALGIKVFFTDLPAGRATIAVRRIMRDTQGVTLVTGANLATRLEFVFRGEETPADAARHAAEKGRTSLSAHGEG